MSVLPIMTNSRVIQILILFEGVLTHLTKEDMLKHGLIKRVTTGVDLVLLTPIYIGMKETYRI